MRAMTPERYTRIGELYHQLLARPVEQRAAVLAEACGDDHTLREEVLSLLAAHDAAASFIETPAIAAAAASLAADHRPIAPGARIGPYEVRALLGRGGMGEVYRAHDPRLGRDVALKLLPTQFALDAQRLARFEREARLLAALNHPNIASLYGIEEANGQRILVLELVHGSTLEASVASGPMSLPEALPIAQQIVEALEAAHQHGIIHRDLKPANIVIRPDGVVKVLDFGLAKVLDPNVSGDAARKVTALTEAHTVIGTAPYMSPEQARGIAGDQRIDIWAFGCVLYEMLTGRRAFDGDTVAEVFSGVLQRDPDWTRIPPDVPPALQRLLRLCLEKDPRRRRQSSGDVRIDLDQVQAEPAGSAPAVHARSSRLAPLAALGVAIVTTVALAVLAVIHFREAPPEMRLQIVTPPTRQPLDFALSPDGRHIVFVGSESSDGVDRLYLRPLGKGDAQPMAGTDGARLPFWSPDSRSVGFFAAGKLYRVDIAGGAARALAAAANPVGGAWSGNGTILFTPDTVSPLFRVPASGGETVAATRLDAPRQTNHRQPSFLPDGRQFLFNSGGSDPDEAGLYLGSLDGGVPKRLTPADSGGAYLAPDRVLFLAQGALVARRFDAARGVLIGDPVTLATSVGRFSVSATGIVAHRAGGPLALGRRGSITRATW
jgi:hypothetical protein